MLWLSAGHPASAHNSVAPAEDIPPAGTPVGHSPFERAVGPTIVNRGSALYDFTSFKLDSEDGKRHYWVQIGIPKRAAPPRGFPVLYMVDGNAAMGLIDESTLEALDILSAPVLVALGYDTYARVDTMSRALDYTPPVMQDGQPITPIVRGRPGGGADAFAKLIEREIKPRVEQLAQIDRQRQTLWGHSYGGLFTLYMLHAHPADYQAYVAGDPSLWYHDGELVDDLLATSQGSLSGKSVRVMRGAGHSAAGSDKSRLQQRKTRRHQFSPSGDAPRLPDTSRGRSPMPNVMEKVVTALRKAGADVHYRRFPELSHGEMMQASLLPALILAARPNLVDAANSAE
ncbi:alpha/beta hydrolase [Altericroceibacterium spongiae]|uniref:Alpha/beta hydrolase n=1 Tax=Altericroceibacterium spongiae TaxID=2320269 RepID=A0A420EPE6_9SPHN|nr:alpha/beta hydrolase-fold protein [Altericroceibacterium spongiae]RKF22558.1 alpha/beta hydrolase [Altericroceibacterium spongiae]